MDRSGVSASHDRWGEPLSGEPTVAAVAPRRARRRWWGMGVGALVVVVSVFVALAVIRHFLAKSLSTSCQEALRTQDWERLEGLADRWRTWEPGRAAPLVYLAEVANQRGQYEQAVRLLGQLSDSDPMTPAALLKRSSLQFDLLNRPIEGAETLERVVRLDPRHAEARRRLVYFYAFTLQRRKMVEHAYEAIRHDGDLPETYVYLMLQDVLSFTNAYDQNTKWFQGNRDEELFLVARAMHRITSRGLDDTEDPREGPRSNDGTPFHRQVVREYYARFPQNLELLAYHLQASIAAGDLAEAERLLSRAPPTAVDDGRLWRYKGWLHAARNELAEAEQSYEKALTLNPYDHVARHQLAGVERRFKRLDRVQNLEDLASEGKALRREILSMPSVNKVSPEMLQRMAEHAQKCGDELVAGKLLFRLRQQADGWLRAPVASPSSSP